MELPSKLLQNAVDQMASLPGVGKRTALRLVLHLLKNSEQEVEQFSSAFTLLKNNIKYCKSCHNISDTEICSICNNSARDHSTLCVVEDVRDLMAIENTMQFKGVYHVLGGVISPMDGIGPNDLKIDSLIEKVKTGKVQEVILALSTTMEGDTTNFYISRKLTDCEVKLSTLSRGVSIGDEIQYADELTLGRSILNRMPYEYSVVVK
ncbi:MAG: recombination mediator RecR [Bacteroidia bacterium]